MVERTREEEATAKAMCFKDCSVGAHIDMEAGCVSRCRTPDECQGWVPYLRQVRADAEKAAPPTTTVVGEATISRETALAALSLLSDADQLIQQKLHTQNPFRQETLNNMCKELGVVVRGQDGVQRFG